MNRTAELEKNPPLLRVTNLRVSYGTNVVLTGTALAVSTDRIYGLTGMNSSGKSTLFRSVMNNVSRPADTVEVAGVGANVARKRDLISYAAQSEEIDWDFPVSVNQVVMMGRYDFIGPPRRPRATDREAVNRTLELVELADLRRRQIGALSGGQKKRTFIAHAITQGAPLVLLDEPFAEVDKYSEAATVELLRRFAAQGIGLVVSMYDLASMGKLYDEAVLLYRRIVCHGGVDGALRPEDLAKAFRLGDSEDIAENAPNPGETPVT